jgi:hypothetical protein
MSVFTVFCGHFERFFGGGKNGNMQNGYLVRRCSSFPALAEDRIPVSGT